MAIDTTDKKLAVLQMNDGLNATAIINETSPFSQGDKQQLLRGYPGILWGELEAPAISSPRTLLTLLVGR